MNEIRQRRRLFGTDGIRGVAGEYPLDPPTVRKIGASVARILAARHPERGAPRILIGRDTRESGEWIESELCAGVRGARASCVTVGVIPTPGVAYLARTGDFSAGIMISASHNPFQDNGIKIFSSSGYKLPDDEEHEIEAVVLSEGADTAEAAAPAKPDLPGEGLVEEYARFLRESVRETDSFAGLKIVLDCANGAASAIAPGVFRDLGAEVIAMGDAPDGRNINAGCGSLHTQGLATAVVAHEAAAGIAFDGDADRTLLVSADGRLADGDLLIYQAAAHLKRQGRLPGDLVVTTVMSNLWLERALAEIGIRMLRAQVGDKYVLEEMIRTGAALGGEQSGHVIFTDRATTGDGILTALRLVEILTSTRQSVSAWLSRVQAYPQILLNVRVASRPDLEAHPVIGAEAERVRRELGDTGRLVLRYSGTEPLARVMIEATDRQTVETLAERLAHVIRDEIGAPGK